ncbi:hypothetical protein ACS0TY_027397 [Phlomoides rotata]
MHIFNISVISSAWRRHFERALGAPIEEPVEVSSPNIELVENKPTRFQKKKSRFKEIRNAEAHFSLRNELIDHLWE